MERNETKHTPGPWEVGGGEAGGDEGSVYCDNTLGSRVAIVYGKEQPFTAFSRDEEKANARLIAAAPTMLEALQEIAALPAHPMRKQREHRDLRHPRRHEGRPRIDRKRALLG